MEDLFPVFHPSKFRDFGSRKLDLVEVSLILDQEPKIRLLCSDLFLLSLR